MDGKIFYFKNTPLPESLWETGKRGVNDMTKFIFDLQRFKDSNNNNYTEQEIKDRITQAKGTGKSTLTDAEKKTYLIQVTYHDSANTVLYFNNMYEAMQSVLGNADTTDLGNKLSGSAEAAEVKLLGDMTGRGFNIGYVDLSTGQVTTDNRKTKVNLDLGGHVYTFTNQAGGAQGSDTRDEGISISITPTDNDHATATDNTTVKISNGVLNVTSAANEYKRVITNYANLTLDNVAIDGTNMQQKVDNDITKAVVTVGFGTLNITGSTSIKAPENVYALGGRYYSPNGSAFMKRYGDGFTITVDTTGTIGKTGLTDWDATGNPEYKGALVFNKGLIESTENQSTLTAENEKGIVVASSSKTGFFTVPSSSKGITVSSTYSNTKFNVDGKEYTFPDNTTITDIAVASIGSGDNVKYYTTLQAAVNAVEADGTITLLKDTSGGGIATFTSINDTRRAKGYTATPKNFTIDFNNHTYTVGNPAVGSTGTESQAFHLEKGGAITFKNGTINIASNGTFTGSMLLQNYCDLTLDGMTIDGTNLNGAGNGKYVSSNNNGTVAIKDTKIIAKTGDWAFDVCSAPNKGYPDGTKVTVSGSSEITGNIELGIWGDQNNSFVSSLTIEGGTIKGDIVDSSGDLIAKSGKVLTVTGGKFGETTFDSRACW